MGSWFLATAYSEFVAIQLAKLAAIDNTSDGGIDVATALTSYTELFTYLLWVGLAGAVVLLIFSPLLKRMMHGIR